MLSYPCLTPDGGVAGRFEMLTYSRVCCAFESTCALPSGVIQGYETISKSDPGFTMRDTGWNRFEVKLLPFLIKHPASRVQYRKLKDNQRIETRKWA